MLRHRGNPLDSQSFKPATLDKKSKTVEDKERKERRELVKRNLISTLQAFYEYDDALTEYQKEFGSVYDKEVLKAAKDYMLQIFSYGVSNDSEYTIAKFEQLCDIFGFSKRWQEDPALVEAVKNIFLYQIEGCNYSAYKLKKSMAVFSDPVIFNNEEIRQAIATQMLQGELNLSERFKILVDWGLPTEALKEHAILKATDLLSASQGYDRGLESRGLNYLISCVDVWPDFLTFSGLQDAVLTSIDSLSSGETLVNYFSTTTNVFENLEERLKLPADFVLRWKKKAVRKIITYSNANASRKLALVIENCKERFNLSDGDFDEAVKTALWDLLIGRHLAEYEFFLHNFQLPYFTSEEEQSYGKKEIEHLLQESNNPAVLDKIVGIQKMASLPVEFFNQPEIASRLVILFAVQYLVEEKTPYDLQVMVTQFGLPETVYGLIDQEMLLHDDLLGKRLQFFLPLVDSPELLHLFPQTLHEIKNLIIQSLSTSDGLAYRFIQNFLVYKKHAWARENISKALDQPLPARRFLEMHENDKRLFSWTGEPRIGELVKKANRVVSDSIIEELKQTGREGLSSEDRFKGHILRYGETDVAIVDDIRRVLTGSEIVTSPVERSIKRTKDKNALRVAGLGTRELREWQQDMDEELEAEPERKVELVLSPEANRKLIEIREAINSAHESFISRFLEATNVPEADKKALVSNGANGAVKMNNLLPNIRGFISRLIAQRAEGDRSQINGAIINTAEEIGDILSEGFEKYLGAYRVDIPLYDILYDEFDNLRVAGRTPREVYLGRDGIYAFIGRRAQDAMRYVREKKVVDERLAKRKASVAINPTYLVYPSYFRDYVTYDVKKAYLEQERVGPDADPIFYDTGYSGSIPEQIMQIMGFSRDEIEKRIRLLSARKTNRRLRGVEGNDDNAVEYIEENPKTENTAVGLIRDTKTGKIRHIAEPGTPKDQFLFSMIKQAIARHYMVKEASNTNQAKTVSLDFEKRTAVVNKGYEAALPKEFISDPESFLNLHGQILEREKTQTTENDSEIFSLRLLDGTEVVVKTIPSYQAGKDAHGEFVFLNIARQRGLPTAEPVGFLAGKESGEKNYLVMKKVEGIPGGQLERQLKETGRFSSFEIKGIMSMVALENKKLAELFRHNAKIDKEWKIEDLMVKINLETGRIDTVTPIDWTEISNYDPYRTKVVFTELQKIEA